MITLSEHTFRQLDLNEIGGGVCGAGLVRIAFPAAATISRIIAQIGAHQGDNRGCIRQIVNTRLHLIHDFVVFGGEFDEV